MEYDNKPENVGGKRFTLYLPPEMKQWVFAKSAEQGINVSDVLRNLIAEAMKQS